MAVRSAGRKATPTRKLKKEQVAAALASSTPPSTTAPPPVAPKIGDPDVQAHLEKGISELKVLHTLLLSTEVDPDVLADFRDALNRVRNTAWAAQQYVAQKESGQDSTDVLSLLAGERIRTAYLLCQSLSEELKRTDVKFQRGSLVQLHEVTKALTETLKHIIDSL